MGHPSIHDTRCRNESVVFDVCLSTMWLWMSTRATVEPLDDTTSDWVAGGSWLKSSRAVNSCEPPSCQAFWLAASLVPLVRLPVSSQAATPNVALVVLVT